MKRTKYLIYLVRLLLVLPLFLLFIVFGEDAEKVLSSLANAFSKHTLL